jgi:hypothetical protein
LLHASNSRKRELSSSNQSFHPSPSSFSVNLVNAPRRQSTTTEDVKELVRISDELERQLQERKSQVAQLQERIRSITNVLNQLGVLPEDSAARDMLGSLRTVVRNTSGHPVANIDVNPQLIRITPTGLMPIDTRKPPLSEAYPFRTRPKRRSVPASSTGTCRTACTSRLTDQAFRVSAPRAATSQSLRRGAS